MVGHVVADAGTAAMAAMSTATGSSTSTVVAAAGAAMAMAVTPSLAETAWSEMAGVSRVGKGRPYMTSSVTTKTANILAILRGGGVTPVATKASKVKNAKDSKGDNSLATRGKSVAFMALAMACHYLGYSFARPITISLFTSKATGYPDCPGAFPFAMAFVSPISLLLLLGYGSILQKRGPRGALQRTTLYCASTILGASAVIEAAQRSDAVLWKTAIPVVKLVSGPLFVFRESYVQLLTSQYWSFMASVLTPNESAKWFAPIAGLTSIASVMGGTAVGFLTERLRLSGTLACTGLALLASTLATGKAYSIAEKNGFSPKPRSKVKAKNSKHEEGGMVSKAQSLFKRVPVLKALFFEILASQSLATLLNVCFVASVGATIPDDAMRAGWVGNFYALINLITMSLQFAVLPVLMQYIEPKDLWRFTPLISLGFTTFQAFQKNPTLYAISGSLLIMKVSEYSARRMLDEMVYVPLDFESRFLGKEIIGVFGYRFGKSCISLSLSALTSIFGQFDLQSLSVMADLAAITWAKMAWNLSSLVPTKAEAQGSFEKASSKKK